MRTLTVLATLVLATSAVTANSPGQEKESERVDEIMTAFNDRLADQADDWFGLGDFPKALRSLEMRAELHPRDDEINTDLIFMYDNLFMTDKALAAAIRYRVANTDRPEGFFPEANQYYKRKIYPMVIALLEQSLEAKGPIHRNIFVLLSRSWKELGFLKQAIRVWERQLKEYPGDPVATMHIKNAKAELAGG
jgi:tetratricopeptide (TPR) repeat protein